MPVQTSERVHFWPCLKKGCGQKNKKREFVFKRDKNWLIKPGFQQLIRSNYFIDNKEIKKKILDKVPHQKSIYKKQVVYTSKEP